MDKPSYMVEWDYLEDRYVDIGGHTYTTLEDIPQEIRHLVRPIKPIKPLKLRFKEENK